MNMVHTQERHGVRLLSLDGGGIRGLSELVILQEVMNRIQFQLNLANTPLPCDYFDMIGGTGTGHDPRAWDAKRVCFPITPSSSVADLPASFVCATSTLNTPIPSLFRTYQARINKTPNCTIWEAARATSAVPPFFKYVVINSPGSLQPFIGGGPGSNNPIIHIIKEAALVFPNQPVTCIISVGAGLANTIGFPIPGSLSQALPLHILAVSHAIAIDCEQSAQVIAEHFLDKPHIYFRFNVEGGLQAIGQAQWEKLDEVATRTAQYIKMEKVDQSLDIAVQALKSDDRRLWKSYDLVGEAMERAQVPSADPPHFSQVDPPALMSLLMQKCPYVPRLEGVMVRERWTTIRCMFGNPPDAVDFTLVAVDTHEAAINAMKGELSLVSAPLDMVFVSKLRLGQRTLQGTGGNGYILFIRNNIFVSMDGLASSDRLGPIAVDVDAFLKANQGNAESMHKPFIKCQHLPNRQVQAGTEFEVAVQVEKAGWMSASGGSPVLQLLDENVKHAIFKFYAIAAGTAEVRMVFAHEKTLQTSTATVNIEVVGERKEVYW